MSDKPKLISKNEGLVVKNLRKTLSKKPIIRNVSLRLEKGKTVGLLGSNGAGKTTTFYSIMGLINPDGGEITLDNKDITALPMYKRANLALATCHSNLQYLEVCLLKIIYLLYWKQKNITQTKNNQSWKIY